MADEAVGRIAPFELLNQVQQKFFGNLISMFLTLFNLRQIPLEIELRMQ
jgi:hypothetical protein